MAIAQLMNKKAFKTIGILLVLLSAYYIYQSVVDLTSSDEIKVIIQKLKLPIAIGVVAYFIGGLSNAWGWALLFEKRLHTSIALIYLKTQIGKYLPGNFGHFAGRQVLVKNLGVSHKSLLLYQGKDLALNLLAALLLIFIAFHFGEISKIENPWILAARDFSPLTETLIGLTLFGFILLTPRSVLKKWGAQRFLMALPFYLFFLLISSLIFYYLANLLSPETQDIGSLIFAYLIAWVLGFVVVGAPGGIGIREATLIYLLTPVLGSAEIIVLASAHRLIAISGELLGFLFALCFKKQITQNLIIIPIVLFTANLAFAKCKSTFRNFVKDHSPRLGELLPNDDCVINKITPYKMPETLEIIYEEYKKTNIKEKNIHYSFGPKRAARDGENTIDLDKENLLAKKWLLFLQDKHKNILHEVILVPGHGPKDLKEPLSQVSIQRVHLALGQAKALQAPLLIFTGGNVHPENTPYNEAYEMKKYAIGKLNVPEEFVFLEPYARHSTTNLRNSARIMKSFEISQALIVTTRGQAQYFGNSNVNSFSLRAKTTLGYSLGNLDMVSGNTVTYTPSNKVFTRGTDPKDP